jgi:hypothetical protein
MTDAGATAGRSENLTVVKRLPVFPAAEAMSEGAGEAVQNVLYSAAVKLTSSHGRQQIPGRDIALAALGLGEWRHPLLRDRLAALGQQHLDLSHNTIRGYLPNVTSRLRKSLQALTDSDIVPRPADDDDKRLGDDPTFETACQIRWAYRGRVPQYYQAARRLRPRIRPLERYTFPFRYPNVDGRVAEVVPIENCDDPRVELDQTKWHTMSVRIPRTNVGAEVDLSYLILVHSTTDDQPYLRHWSTHHGRPATVGVLFDPSHAPSHVWAFENQSAQQSPKPGALRDAIKVPIGDAPRYVEHTFNQVRDRYFGFVWSWPQTETVTHQAPSELRNGEPSTAS